MNKFRTRLLFTIISLVVVVVIALGMLMNQLIKGFYVENFNKRIQKEVQYLALEIQQDGIAYAAAHPAVLKRAEELLKVRITLVDKHGDIIYDSVNDRKEPDRSLMDKIAERPDAVSVQHAGNDAYYYGTMIADGQQDTYLILQLAVNSIASVQQQIWGLLVGSFLFACIMIVLIGLRVTARYTRPIEAATRVAIELAKGNYKARAYENHADETGMLSQAINILARNLQEMVSQQEMQQDRLHTLIENMGSGMILIDSRGYISLVNRSYKEIFRVTDEQFLHQLYYEAFPHQEVISLVEDIFMTEVKVRKQMLLPLEIERRHFEVYGAPIIGTNHEWKGIVLVFHDITELKRLEQMRKDFLANVSHELRTPITSIKGFSETLLDGAMENEKLRENFLSIILKESDRMQNLIEDLLDLSKIEQQGFQLNMGRVDLRVLLEEIVLLLKHKAEAKQIDLQLQAERDVFAAGDPHRLKQVFLNLISNAISYTPPEGSVTVELGLRDSWAVVRVSDTGIGISREEIPRIFERFYRVDKARSRNTGGTGLGLSIVKHLVEAHHGSITVESTVGAGTTFTVMLQKY
ncbi:two-component system histidine kinase PnpS [Ectobacillus ponti]|uniref:histidine kinase n=1 Tax=Ectobacillus ponti TaxID=2961894 RepID=A0AA42BRI6_9BACI|nr:ATP-binding protein [Ectobacillus ponti]MCP8967423.1 cell wall metabolism sensor histidine kinase WalK [Ectobacillus ponti]